MLRNFVHRLPGMGGSHYVEAMRKDPDVIERILDQDEENDGEDRTWNPRGEEWDQDSELLGKILDQLTALVSIMEAHPIPAGGRRPRPIKPHPRPVRILDKYRLERRQRESDEFQEEIEEAKRRWREAQERGELPEADIQ